MDIIIIIIIILNFPRTTSISTRSSAFVQNVPILLSVQDLRTGRDWTRLLADDGGCGATVPILAERGSRNSSRRVQPVNIL